MKRSRCTLFAGIWLICAVFLPASLWHAACAADFPTHPVTLVVPFAPGGSMDAAARAMADAMEKHLKQSIVIQSKPGGGTTIAGNFVASAKPDGYTLGFFPGSTYVPEIYTFNPPVPYSSKDLRPVSGIIEVVQPILVKGDAPWNTMKEFVDYAQKNPGVKVATLGKAQLGHYIIALVTKQEKIRWVGIPFDGGSKMIPALLGGHVPIGITGLDPTVQSLLESKKFRALAVSTRKRAVRLPDVPSLDELGYKLPFQSISGVFGPKGMPEEVVKTLSEVIRKVSEEKGFGTKIRDAGGELNYLDSASYDKALVLFKEKTYAFFKEEGLVK
jgi:tripartite-type tricarboxylate transporter receptor subunit TctC